MACPLLDVFARTFAEVLEKAFVTRSEKRPFGFPYADAEDDPRFSAFRQGRWFANRAALGPLREIFGDHLRHGWPRALEWVADAGCLTPGNLEEALGEMHCCSGAGAALLARKFRLSPAAAQLIAEKVRADWNVGEVLAFARESPFQQGAGQHVGSYFTPIAKDVSEEPLDNVAAPLEGRLAENAGELV
jgi:hypothetical protein